MPLLPGAQPRSVSDDLARAGRSGTAAAQVFAVPDLDRLCRLGVFDRLVNSHPSSAHVVGRSRLGNPQGQRSRSASRTTLALRRPFRGIRSPPFHVPAVQAMNPSALIRDFATCRMNFKTSAISGGALAGNAGTHGSQGFPFETADSGSLSAHARNASGSGGTEIAAVLGGGVARVPPLLAALPLPCEPYDYKNPRTRERTRPDRDAPTGDCRYRRTAAPR